MKSTHRHLTIVLISLLVGIVLVDNPLTELYIAKLKADAVPVTSVEDSLYMEIVAKKAQYEKEPIDARIDPVWKKMPGLAGLRVDIDASYEKMKAHGYFDENDLVFEEIPPRVSLKDLPPAPIYRGLAEKPQVAFTVNVAWGNEYLSPLLSTLKKYHLHITFFVEGRWAKQNPDLVKIIADGGHEIGNHSYSHPDMRTLNREQIIKELTDTNVVIKATTEQEVQWFAPPSGSYNEEVVKIASELGMETIMWTVDTIDWQNPTPSTIIDRVTKQVHNGAIILMHPTKSTVAALEPMILKLQSVGYKIVPVGELLDEHWPETIVKTN